MAANAWMPLYTRDLICSTADMTQQQFGAYLRLLCYAWDNGGLPNCMEACGRIAGGMTPTDWRVIRKRLTVLDEGTSEERLSHQRLEAERAKSADRYDAKCRAAQKARESRAKSLEAELIQGSVVSFDNNSDNNPDDNTVINIQSQSQSQSENKNVIPTGLLRTTRKPRRSYRVSWDADAGFAGITDADMETWRSAYPGTNLNGEIAKAHAWLRANPQKAGKRNWSAFLTRWFSRVQDRGGNSSSPPAAIPKFRADAGREMTAEEYRKWKQRQAHSEYVAAQARRKGVKAELQPDRVMTASDLMSGLNASAEARDGDYPN